MLVYQGVLSFAHRADVSLDMSEKFQLLPVRIPSLFKQIALKAVGRTQEGSCKVYAGKTAWKTNWKLYPWSLASKKWGALEAPWQMTPIRAAFVCSKACDIAGEDAKLPGESHAKSVGRGLTCFHMAWSCFLFLEAELMSYSSSFYLLQSMWPCRSRWVCVASQHSSVLFDQKTVHDKNSNGDIGGFPNWNWKNSKQSLSISEHCKKTTHHTKWPSPIFLNLSRASCMCGRVDINWVTVMPAGGRHVNSNLFQWVVLAYSNWICWKE